ncbi:transcription factor bHLH25 isoform X1 [Lathyrus oleraceus]|uniref:transcription factor bHLH25 isoform X1 n=1 Tax=Pisum sativum TaxID=3888 RepID=UPI0021D32FF0|nr:transcription factor bHLH25-like isoform X1 [Pisum sativum]
MEESGENWPCDSDLEICDDVIFEDGESESCDEEIRDSTDKNGRYERDLREKMLTLSAIIPGLEKMDDTSILDKARQYVKQLQERVNELKEDVGPTNIYSDNCGTSNHNILPNVKARVLQKQVLITIHCEKQKSVMLKILTHLENLHLLVLSSSVLQFGKVNFDITIVAQMGDGYNITMDELVKTLRIVTSTK